MDITRTDGSLIYRGSRNAESLRDAMIEALGTVPHTEEDVKDFSNADLDGADLSGMRLSNRIFSGASMVGVDFTNALAEDCLFYNCDLMDTVWVGAQVSDSHFDGSDLSGSSINQALGKSEISTRWCDMTGTNFVRWD